MGLWTDVRTGFGQGVGQLGGLLGLKERGYSERVGNNPSPWAMNFPKAKASELNGLTTTQGNAVDRFGNPVTLTNPESTPDATDYTNNTTGGGEPEPTFMRYLNGQMYDDPIAYASAVNEAAVAELNRQNKILENAYQSGLLEFAQYQDQLKQARENVKTQYGEAMGGISGRFSNISPDAYQSQQGVAEARTGDITNQNYANIAGQEANLGQQKELYNQDYTNKIQDNELARQQQIDATMNSTADSLAGTEYANRMGEISAPQLNTLKPMDSSILGVYDNLSALSASGNTAAIKKVIDESNADPSIKQWLYTRFAPQQ